MTNPRYFIYFAFFANSSQGLRFERFYSNRNSKSFRPELVRNNNRRARPADRARTHIRIFPPVLLRNKRILQTPRNMYTGWVGIHSATEQGVILTSKNKRKIWYNILLSRFFRKIDFEKFCSSFYRDCLRLR